MERPEGAGDLSALAWAQGALRGAREGVTAVSGMRYEVRRHEYGCPGPGQPPQHRWTPILTVADLPRAVVAAMALEAHAVVVAGAETVFDNGREPTCPRGWIPAQR